MSSTTTIADICNVSLRSLGADNIDAITDDNDSARALNDVYSLMLEEVVSAHPWNFAIKRASLTVLGGLITTWTAEGTENVWQAALTAEPAKVLFNGVEGTEQISVATLTAENYWYWLANVLYVYSTSDPDTAYDSPGINAVIPEYDFNFAYTVPTDSLRIIRSQDDNVTFIIEEGRILTDESPFKIQYISQITDTTKFPPAFITAFAARLAAEIAIPVTNKPNIAIAMMKLYEVKLRLAKAVDAQEGTGQFMRTSNWRNVRG